nr:21.7 kDa class VI heat shock protein [Ipomoea batatas]
MTSYKQLEVGFEDPNPRKWCVPLKEDAFASLMEKGNNATAPQKVFSQGSLFSPFLFGKFFDPSDAFPLWEFESDVLLANLRCSNHCTVDWLQTETDYILKAELPVTGVQICVANRKVLEISGLWRQQREARSSNDWRSGQWWEQGYVRRIELPENADWRKTEASVNNDIILQIRVPKAPPNEISRGSNGAAKDSEIA